jgi:hypothetical protein
MELTDEVRALALDTLQSGWFRYGRLSDDTQIRCTWRGEGSDTWLQVENLETGHVALFTLDVTVTPHTRPPVGPEDDGALRAEIAEYEDHPYELNESANPLGGCTAMVMRNGGGDQCGRPSGVHRTAAPTSAFVEAMRPELEAAGLPLEPATECANCAPLVAGVSATRVDGTGPTERCEDCREPYPCIWSDTRPGDEVQGEDGGWYPVEGSDPNRHGTFYKPIQTVTLTIGDRGHTYDMPGGGFVRIRRGAQSQAENIIQSAFPGSEVIRR